MKPLIFPLILLGCTLTGSFSCKSLPEPTAPTPEASEQPAFEPGVLVIKVRDDHKGTLPVFVQDSLQLGTYPYLGDLIPEYEIQSIRPLEQADKQLPSNKLYKIQFNESIAVDAFISALTQLKIIEFAEKVPVNKPN